MTRKKLIKLYVERKDAFQHQINTLHNKSVLISWIRVATALVIAVLLYLSFQLGWLWLITVLTAFAYAYLVSVHERIQYQRNFHKHLLAINESEIRSLNHDHTGFDAGHEFMNNHHPYALDLDIFGEGSLFQRINRTCTEPGKARLAEIMSQPLTTMSTIKERQELLQELAPKLDFRQHFQATGLMAPEKKEDQEQLMAWLTTPSWVYGKKRYTIMLIIFPLLALGGLMYWLVSGLATPFVLIALAQWTIIGSHMKRVSAFQEYIGNKRHLLEKYSGHFRLLMEENFNTPMMTDFRQQSKEAYHELRTLASRSRALDLRLNMLASLMLNSVMLYDLFCVYRLEQWRHKNSHHLGRWLHAIRETDALNSLGTFVFNHPGYVFPDITDQRNFSATELGHPLLSDEACIGNDVTMDEHANVWIVTGANMAGKSTFLRTTGVNVVLALTGCVVRAAKMACPIVEVHTGMRNTDSINDNQSYFFAELLRLQKIMERLREGQPMLILLDEILKGTNSVDKLTGSEELVRQLAGSTSLVMIATHDVALGELERQYATVKNYHFETMIHQDELSFDYKLKPGVSTGKNATFLMKKMGIIPS